MLSLHFKLFQTVGRLENFFNVAGTCQKQMALVALLDFALPQDSYQGTKLELSQATPALTRNKLT